MTLGFSTSEPNPSSNQGPGFAVFNSFSDRQRRYAATYGLVSCSCRLHVGVRVVVGSLVGVWAGWLV